MPSRNVDRWRALAEEMRRIALEMLSPEIREAMLRLAAEWEHRARSAEIEVEQERSRLN